MTAGIDVALRVAALLCGTQKAQEIELNESVSNLVNVLLKKRGNAGLEYLDYLGRTVPW